MRSLWSWSAVSMMLAATACGSAGPQTYGTPKAPVTQISNADYQTLLAKYVGDDGKVDYAKWKSSPEDVSALDTYLSTLCSATPDTRPDLFKTQPEKLSYWINLYNAVVLREIVRMWPVPTASGKPFFYELAFKVGEQPMNLFDVENKILRAKFHDARIHFAISCGSSSCPLLRKDAFDSSKLDGQLDDVSTEFVNDGKNVLVDDTKKQVTMSKIFAWYADDFVSFTRAKSNAKEAGLVDFALLYAKEPLASKLKEAKANRYRVGWRDYDWKINQQDGARSTVGPFVGARAPLELVGKPVPDYEFSLIEGAPADKKTWSTQSAKGKVVILDFWATFCRPCVESFPRLQALHEKHKDQGLVIVGVSEDDEPKAVVPSFLEQAKASFMIASDPDQRAATSPFKVTAMPTELIIDRQGIVRHRHEGLRDGEIDEIAKEVEDLLKEK